MHVTSEISTLKKVLLHRPGNELKALNEDNKNHYLFDEIPNLEIAQKEHDQFAEILKSEGVEVVYLEDLMAEVIKDKTIKEKFIKDYLLDADINDEKIYDYFSSIKDEKELVLKTMEGIKGKIDAMPNLYFTRDPFTIINDGIALYNMHTKIRAREVIYGEYINKYHKDFGLKVLYERTNKEEIEGGDVLVLNKDTIAIGVSERTRFEAALRLANNLFEKTNIKNVLTIEFPKKRACMHLDTILTRINDNTFSLYDEFYDNLSLRVINKDEIIKQKADLKETLSTILQEDIRFIRSSNKDEQWNDAYNTLAITPNKIIVYDVNEEVNKHYEDNGITLLKLKSKELTKGRGGARCMSMPLIRK